MRIPDLKKFVQLGKKIAEERGPFTLYALLKREDEYLTWDLIVSAPWVQGATIETMEYVLGRMKQWLTKAERDSISHVILLRPEEPTVKTILDAYQPVSKTMGILDPDIQHVYINGMLIERGYILAAEGKSNPLEHALKNR